jgi:penicillin-binding protein 2
MMNQIKKKYGRRYKNPAIDPDEIFVDSSNLPGFDTHQFEGRLEKPISTKTFIFLGVFFGLVFLIFVWRLWNIQIANGERYMTLSENNQLRNTWVFSDRGLIYDRNNKALAWNEHGEENFNLRKYIETPGFSNLLGYISYPKKDKYGFYYDEVLRGVDGIEEYYNELLEGENGERIIQVNALNKVVSENIMRPPQNGQNINLTIDADLQVKLYESVENIVNQAGFKGGGAVIIDIYNGDIISLVSYPEFDSNIMSEGENSEIISGYRNDPRKPFLNKVIEGQYTPGSVVKPYVAIATLQERVMNATDKIVSRGTLEVPNPYNPDNPSIFTDWKAHGPVNIREALAMSSNIYFYVVGGGHGDIEGLGISRIEEYMKKFGFGKPVENELFDSISGTVPNPQWKRRIFDDDWRLGDTYFTAIGQYGFQVTPLQMVRAVAAIANKGMLVEPNLILDTQKPAKFSNITGIEDWVWETVQDGMRDVVLFGTGKGLNYSDFPIAGKTGTAELGVTKERVNSWFTGFWPYENPRYAIAVFLEEGDRKNLIGGVAVSRQFFDWLKSEKLEYLK